MERKSFNNYSQDEKRKLLLQWWHNDGNMSYSLKELLEFIKVVDTIPDTVFRVAAIDYVTGFYSIIAHHSMHNGGFYNYCVHHNNPFIKPKNKLTTKIATHIFTKEMVKKYNQDVRDGNCIIDRILELANETEQSINPLTVDNISELYNKCALSETDFEVEKLLVDFTIGEGFKSISVFSTERINANRREIARCISLLPKGIAEGITFDKLSRNFNGLKWTDDVESIDMLVQLGMACDLLYFPAPREDWQYLPGGVPYVASNATEAKKVSGHKPYEYVKIKDNIKK